MSCTRTRGPGRRGRRGGAMIVALVCLTVSVLLIGSLLRIAVADRRQLRAEQTLLQADWLAESALNRTAYRLRNQPDYAGERWDIAAADLNGRHSGRVDISVAVAEGDATRRSVTVTAVYPADAELFSKRTKTILIKTEPTR